MTHSRNKAPSQRQLRVGEEIRHVLARILAQGHLRDPELREVPITVTEVRASPDLRAATVFVMPLGGGEEAAVVKALNRAAPYLRGQLGRELTLRYTPSLRFEVDQSFAEAERVEARLREIAAREGREPGSLDTGNDDGA